MNLFPVFPKLSYREPKSLESKDWASLCITSYWLRTGNPRANGHLSPSQEVWALHTALRTTLQWSAMEGEQGVLVAERGGGSAFEDARKMGKYSSVNFSLNSFKNNFQKSYILIPTKSRECKQCYWRVWPFSAIKNRHLTLPNSHSILQLPVFRHCSWSDWIGVYTHIGLLPHS